MLSHNWTDQWASSALGHGIFVLAGLLTYLTSTRISKQHRPPSAAIAWVLLIALLPYLGIPLYLLFGVRKVPRARAAPVARSFAPICDARARWALTLMNALSMPAPTCNANVAFHADGQLALRAILDMIKNAREQVDVCTYVLGNDSLGRALADALVQAARRGVRVRLLLDAVGSWWTSRPMLERLRRNGVAVAMFVPFWPNLRHGRVNLRNHRKMIVVDGERVWSGGRNLASEYFVDDKGVGPWSDISFVIQGPAARQAQSLFELDWHAANGAVPPIDHRVPPVESPPEGAMAQWIPSGPDHADDTVYGLLLAAAYRAERQIMLVSPYFVPDEALLTAWCMACRRGVRVTLVVPRRSNHRMADLARVRSLRQLAEAGGAVMLYPGMLHAKGVIIDDELALCGSANLDSRSLFLNYELTAAFYGKTEIEWLQQWAHGLVPQCEPASMTTSSWPRDVLEGLVRVVGFQL